MPVDAGADRYEALLAVLEQQAEQSREVPARGRTSSFGRGRELLVVVLVVVSGWLWLAPPGWLAAGPEPPPIAEEEAALRFRMYLQAQRIRAYELEHGGLPERLEEAGPPLPRVEYRVLEGRYELTGATDRLRLVYSSDQPLREFVGSGADVVDEARLP